MADETKNVAAEEKVERPLTEQEPTASDAPAEDAGSEQKNLSRPSATEIYQQVAKNAKEELKRSTVSLAISGLTGGIFMGLSALGRGNCASPIWARVQRRLWCRGCFIRWGSLW